MKRKNAESNRQQNANGFLTRVICMLYSSATFNHNVCACVRAHMCLFCAAHEIHENNLTNSSAEEKKHEEEGNDQKQTLCGKGFERVSIVRVTILTQEVHTAAAAASEIIKSHHGGSSGRQGGSLKMKSE